MASEGIPVQRAEIDTRAPFQSVKEAVILFGERILAGEFYAKRLQEMQGAASDDTGHGHGHSRLGSVTTELEETKQNLMKAREEGMVMSSSLSSLKEELEQTRKELQRLKARESEKRVVETQTEDIKFVEDMGRPEGDIEFQRKRYVKFANPPSLAQVLTTKEVTFSLKKEAIGEINAHGRVNEGAMLERYPSIKKKKKPLIPLIGGIFSKKKGLQEGSTPKARAS